MKKLLTYFNNLNDTERCEFLRQTGLSEGYLRRACSTAVKMSPERCVTIERATGDAVTRKDLRPQDWADMWPELAEKGE